MTSVNSIKVTKPIPPLLKKETLLYKKAVIYCDIHVQWMA